MRIVSKKGEFDLPIDFEVEITVSNPFLSDIGEQSTPFNLPTTENNLSLLGYSHRFDSLYKPVESLKVQVMDGLMCRTCQMQINSIDADSINTTLYLGSSDFYNQINDVNLQSLDWDVFEPPLPTLREKILWLLNILTNLYKNPESEFLHDKFVVVPVATTQSADDITGYKEVFNSNASFVLEVTKRYNYIVLNDFARYPATHVFSDEDELGFRGFRKLQGSSLRYDYDDILIDLPRKLKINGEEIDVGLSYGVTPFYRLTYVLQKIFAHFGYELIDYLYKIGEKEILLNNVADALFEGKIEGRQLVPSVTIKEFLSKIEKMYAFRFVSNGITKKVKPVSYYSFLSANIEKDLTPFVVSQAVRGKSNFELLIIERNNSKNITSSAQSQKKKTIKVDTLTEMVTYGQSYLIDVDDEDQLQTVVIYPVVQKIDGVIHLNSVKVSENTEEEETHSMKEIRVCSYETGTDYYVPDSFSLKYNRSVPSSVEDTGVFGGADRLELSYNEYKDFLASSNVPVEVELLLSKSEIQRLDLTKPYLLFNRKVYFEKLTYKLGADNRCKAFFRTAEPYIERP